MSQLAMAASNRAGFPSRQARLSGSDSGGDSKRMPAASRSTYGTIGMSRAAVPGLQGHSFKPASSALSLGPAGRGSPNHNLGSPSNKPEKWAHPSSTSSSSKPALSSALGRVDREGRGAAQAGQTRAPGAADDKREAALKAETEKIVHEALGLAGGPRKKRQCAIGSMLSACILRMFSCFSCCECCGKRAWAMLNYHSVQIAEALVSMLS